MPLGSYDSAAFTTATGVAVAATADVEVRRESDGALADIKSDRAGATPIVQPGFQADANGRFIFFAAGISGGYHVKVTKGAETHTARYQATGTARELDADPFWAAVWAAATAAAARLALGFAAIAAKGDSWWGSAADTIAKLAVGANGTTLIADSAQATGTKWAAFPPLEPGGRLTLTTGVPVTTADVSGATTVYYTPYKHNGVVFYDGTWWIPSTFVELSQATSDATKSPAAVANDSNYDVFVWDDAGTLRATRGPAWTSDTARGAGAGTTELELFEGRLVNKNAITNGPAARRGLYVGSIRSDGSAQINDTLAKRHVWNAHSRVVRPMKAVETTDSWTYTTGTIRQANAAAANQLDFLVGLSEDAIIAQVQAGLSSNTANHGGQVGIGLDSTTVNSATIHGGGLSAVANIATQAHASYRDFPGLGRHTLVWLEAGTNAGSTTWYGDVAAGNFANAGQSGIHGEMLA